MIKGLEKALGYSFQKTELLKKALAHRSYGKENNERLEFLGDSLLNFIIAEDLFNRFPKAVEGELSRLRATLVKGETLAKIALKLKLGPYLLLGSGELKSGGEHRNSILADALEAVIAAIYLDTGLEVCRQCVLAWLKEELAYVSPDRIIKDPKSTLQEYIQSRQLPLPEYRLVATSGKEHEQVFTVECLVALLDHSVVGVETSRRRAEQQAAANALMELGIND